ncbi:MAG: hypothetical protein RLZZ623_1353 [Actinomycetota bacterium]|jgi:hypothetical protein
MPRCFEPGDECVRRSADDRLPSLPPAAHARMAQEKIDLASFSILMGTFSREA